MIIRRRQRVNSIPRKVNGADRHLPNKRKRGGNASLASLHDMLRLDALTLSSAPADLLNFLRSPRAARPRKYGRHYLQFPEG
jgi:hypothetical protein